MVISPACKSVTYKIGELGYVEDVLNDIEKDLFEKEGVTPERARTILSDLNTVREHLGFKQGAKRLPEKKEEPPVKAN